MFEIILLFFVVFRRREEEGGGGRGWMGEEVRRKGRGKSSRRPLGTSVVSLSLVLLCWGIYGCRRLVEEGY